MYFYCMRRIIIIIALSPRLPWKATLMSKQSSPRKSRKNYVKLLLNVPTECTWLTSDKLNCIKIIGRDKSAPGTIVNRSIYQLINIIQFPCELHNFLYLHQLLRRGRDSIAKDASGHYWSVKLNWIGCMRGHCLSKMWLWMAERKAKNEKQRNKTEIIIQPVSCASKYPRQPKLINKAKWSKMEKSLDWYVIDRQVTTR